jgi:hypothetical protein
MRFEEALLFVAPIPLRVFIGAVFDWGGRRGYALSLSLSLSQHNGILAGLNAVFFQKPSKEKCYEQDVNTFIENAQFPFRISNL